MALLISLISTSNKSNSISNWNFRHDKVSKTSSCISVDCSVKAFLYRVSGPLSAAILIIVVHMCIFNISEVGIHPRNEIRKLSYNIELPKKLINLFFFFRTILPKNESFLSVMSNFFLYASSFYIQRVLKYWFEKVYTKTIFYDTIVIESTTSSKRKWD